MQEPSGSTNLGSGSMACPPDTYLCLILCGHAPINEQPLEIAKLVVYLDSTSTPGDIDDDLALPGTSPISAEPRESFTAHL